MPEGDGTVLDNSLILFMSNMWSGSRHDSTKVPVLQIGGLGGTLETGRVLDYRTRATRTASSAACTCPSWTAWESRSTALATPTRVLRASNKVGRIGQFVEDRSTRG